MALLMRAVRSLAVLALLAAPATALAEISKEYQIKAAFLYNFTKFVEWPAASFAGADDPIVLGVLCGERLEAELEKIVSGRKVNGRRLSAVRVEDERQAAGVDALFVCADQDPKFAAIRDATAGHPVLIVGETEWAARQGAVITFVLEDDKVRFRINVGTAERADLKVSAQLQKLAVPQQAP